MEKRPMMYQQRTLDFEATQTEEQAYVAESTSEPPPADQGAKKPPPLIRPDRQIVYPDAPNHYHWPDAKLLHDHDTITVDRITDDIDGPAHRFVIKRGDTVEAYMAHNNFHVGEVIGISHAKQEVRVAWDSTLKKGGWFHVGCIYPATEPAPARPLNGQPLSQVIATVNAEHENGLTEADRVPSPSTPVTPAAILDFLNRHAGQGYSTGDLRHQFDCTAFDPANPLENPVHQALRELRDSGKAHVVEPRWGDPRFSVLDLPDSAAELTLAHCPQSLSGPEIRRLFTKHKQTIAEFATRYGFTQKHVREVFERGLDEQNAVRDWLEAILTPVSVAGDSTAAAPPSAAALAPYTFEDFKKFHGDFRHGGIAYDDYREQFERLLESRDAVKQELMARYKAKEMAVLASRFGSWHAKRSTKEDNAAHIVQKMLSSFVLDGTVSYQPLSGETYEDAVTKKVRATTAGEYARSFEKRQEESQAHEKALSNPETFAEFRTFIIDIHELRAALREYLGHRGEARGDSPILIAERELIGKKLPGFFPTPRPVIEQMLELAGIESHHRVLEPSCGKGDILDALKESHQDIMLHAIEWNRTLSDVLSAKGHDVEYGDFLEHVGVYDRILMNPPFEQGADMAHIQHAYSLLVAGGRLVSVISEGPFFRSDTRPR